MIEDETKTLWCGNLADQVTEELLYELFLQAGPLEKVRIAKDKDGRQKNFAFITYCHEVSVPYALSLFRGTALFHRTLYLQSKSRELLPPPIRCFGPETNVNFGQNNSNVVQQFSDMTEQLKHDNLRPSHIPCHQDMNNLLVVASLQGNWSHRHHPYRSKDKLQTRDEYRYRENHNDNYNNRNNHSGNWRDRRNHRNHRRDRHL